MSTTLLVDEPLHEAFGSAGGETRVYPLASGQSWVERDPDGNGEHHDMVNLIPPPQTHYVLAASTVTADVDAFQPRTELGRRLLELRRRIVAAGTRQLSIDEVNEELSIGRRHR